VCVCVCMCVCVCVCVCVKRHVVFLELATPVEEVSNMTTTPVNSPIPNRYVEHSV